MKTSFRLCPLWLLSVLGSSLICIRFVCSESLSSRLTFGNETDQQALLDLRKCLVNGNNGALTSWNSSLHFCQWQGITCGNLHQRVISLSIVGLELGGLLPPSIGNLTFLRRITISGNHLDGGIPKEIGRLPQLQYLNLSENSLGGPIPDDIANCSNLQTIDLSENRLRGSLPCQIGSMLKLLYLWLPANNLTGGIPSSLGNLTSLIYLSLGNNNVEGEIPSDLGRLQNMTRLRLYANNLSGTIPSSLFNLSSIGEFSVASNNLSGDFLPSIGLGVPSLRYLILGYNNFTGPIPASLGNISGLEYFDAPSNNLSGQVPRDLGALKNLQWFNVEYNSLGTGRSGDLDFLISMANDSNLVVLGMKSNNFGGYLPVSFFNVSTQLTRVTLGSNAIIGSVPEGIGKLINLVQLGMEENSLTGVIPESIGNLKALEKLDLTGNRLSGTIPSLGNLTRIFFLSLANNNLEGGIPSSLKYCNKLQTLLLSDNSLSGTIPENFVSHLDQLITLYLHQNSLTGSFPGDVGSLKNLRELSVFGNQLSGQIPFELGSSLGLEFLSMAANLLEGGIPSSLSDLKALQFLDLSSNILSGTIPIEIEDLTGLWNLNLSFNHLEGKVPSKGVFRNLSAFEFTGNGQFCGGIPQLHLPACSTRNMNSKKALSKAAIIGISVATVSGLALLVAVVILLRRRQSIKQSSSTSSSGDRYLRISYKEIYDATGGFASSNLIGTGSFASVYKGILGQDQSPIAVKVLDLQKHGASKSFIAECRALGGIRHRHLLKIITSCSSMDFKGNEFMALIFDFMPNGSLDSWLHRSNRLTFIQRLDIASDIASALVYLHCHCKPAIVHCDLKPSNVLLDNDMVAHVGDFGLARILFEESVQSKNQSSFFAIRGSIGYVAPEYGMGGELSQQGDVYSYGILLLELITGRRPTDDIFKDGLGLHSYAKMALSGKAGEIADPYLLPQFVEGRDMSNGKRMELLVSIIKIGIACSMEHPDERMNISYALKELQAIKSKFIEAVSHESGRMQHLQDA